MNKSAAKTKPLKPEDTRRRKFPPWAAGASDRVLWRVAMWDRNYESTANGAIPANPRKWVPPNKDDYEAVSIATRYRHKIAFTLNELRWLRDVMVEENPETPVAKLFQAAYEAHLDYIRKNPSFTGGYTQDYDLAKEEVQYIHVVLERIHIGKPTPGQLREIRDDIGKGDW